MDKFAHLILFLLIPLLGNANLSPPEVEIRSYNYNEEFGNFTEIETKYFNNDGENVIAVVGTQLEIWCYANYPVVWKTDGYVGRVPLDVKVSTRETVDVFDSTSSNSSSRIWIPLDEFSTGYYTCHSYENTSLAAPTYVFVKNEKMPLINSGQNITVTGRILPCRTTNPEVLVSLLRPIEENNNYERIPVTYDPKVGFNLEGDNYIPGHYLCITPFDKIRIEVLEEEIKDFEVIPDKRDLLLLENDILNLTCIAQDDIDLEYLGNKTDGVMLQTTAHSKTFLYRGKAGESGSVTCLSKHGGYTWSFRFIETPRLVLDDVSGAALCYSDISNRTIASLDCSNPSECNVFKNCLKEENCPDLTYQGAACRPEKCAKLRNSHFSGILTCGVQDLRVSREYFTALDGRRYFDWKSAPRNSIIHMDNVTASLYENQTSYFFCEASSFLFIPELKFVLKYSNGSLVTIPEDVIENETTQLTVDRIKRGTLVRGVYLKLSEDVKEVLCMAPWWNSTQWLNASTPVSVKKSEQPSVSGQNSTTFFVGEKGRNLFCSGFGEPSPKLRWVKGSQVLPEDPFTTSETTDGDLILHFPEINKSLEGKYTCLASNSVGKDKLIVNVAVIDRNQTETPCLGA